jgi:hypothetical protein
MITSFDDYPIHQTSTPVATPGSSDRNFYDRYWFNGFDKDGTVYLGAALGIYPNRRVMDAHFSVLVDGIQTSFHASRRAPTDRSELRVGPLRIEVVEPMRQIRVVLEPNETGVECDLLFQARTVPYEEPHSTLTDDGQVILDTCRFTQYGTWGGAIDARGTKVVVDRDRFVGVRDRSWGVRPVGERPGGAPSRQEPGIYWVWSVNHFDDICTHYATFEDHDGLALQSSGAILPAYANLSDIPAQDRGICEMRSAHLDIDWTKGTRWASRATLELHPFGQERQVITIEPLIRFHMKGIGYQHPEWGHGVWKGEEAMAAESWRVDDLDPLSYDNIHIHHICRVTMGDRRGIGTLEQLILGSHKPSGFKSFFDGAS